MLKTNFDPNEFVAASQVAVTVVGHITVSTVRLPKFMGENDRFETCLFADSGPSMVIQTYTNRVDAVFGHRRLVATLNFFVKPEVG